MIENYSFWCIRDQLNSLTLDKIRCVLFHAQFSDMPYSSLARVSSAISAVIRGIHYRMSVCLSVCLSVTVRCMTTINETSICDDAFVATL